MIYYPYDVKCGQIVWGWIKVQEENIYVPAQIKYIRILPYQGFEYILPDESWEFVKDGEYRQYVNTSNGLKSSEYDAIFADSKNELLDFRIDKLKKAIDGLQAEIKGWEILKELD